MWIGIYSHHRKFNHKANPIAQSRAVVTAKDGNMTRVSHISEYGGHSAPRYVTLTLNVGACLYTEVKLNDPLSAFLPSPISPHDRLSHNLYCLHNRVSPIDLGST